MAFWLFKLYNKPKPNVKLLLLALQRDVALDTKSQLP